MNKNSVTVPFYLDPLERKYRGFGLIEDCTWEISKGKLSSDVLVSEGEKGEGRRKNYDPVVVTIKRDFTDDRRTRTVVICDPFSPFPLILPTPSQRRKVLGC